MKKPKTLIREAIKAYQKIDGATKMGALRDAITDIMHEAHKKKFHVYTDDPLLDVREMGTEAYNIFLEEMEMAEYDKVLAIPKNKLPLHIHDKYQFDSSRELFIKRLKGGMTNG